MTRLQNGKIIKLNLLHRILIFINNKIQEFIKSIHKDKISAEKIDYIVNALPQQFPDENYNQLICFIDFDSKIYANWLYNVKLEGYLLNYHDWENLIILQTTYLIKLKGDL